MYYCLRLGGFRTDLFFYYMVMLKFVVLDKIDFKLPQFKNIHNFEGYKKFHYQVDKQKMIETKRVKAFLI